MRKTQRQTEVFAKTEPSNWERLVPSRTLILRSAAFTGILTTAFFLAFVAWIAFYSAVNVRIGESLPVWLQYGYSRPPFSDISLSSDGFIAANLPYDVALHLTVPVTKRNLDMGNFMVDFVLESSDGEVIAHASKPASLNSKGLFGRILGPFVSDVQLVTIPLLEHTILNNWITVPNQIHLQVGRDDAYESRGIVMNVIKDGGELQVYKATLTFYGHLSGLRWLVYHHPIISFIIFFPSFLLLELFSAFFMWGFFLVRAEPIRKIAPPPTVPAGKRRPTSYVKTESGSEKSTLDLDAKQEETEDWWSGRRQDSRVRKRLKYAAANSEDSSEVDFEHQSPQTAESLNTESNSFDWRGRSQASTSPFGSSFAGVSSSSDAEATAIYRNNSLGIETSITTRTTREYRNSMTQRNND